MRKGLIALSLAAAVVFGASAGASAGRSSISLVMPGASTAASTGPQYGSQVTFSVKTSTSYPWVDTKCSQNGQVVYEQWAGFFPSYSGGQMFTLGPTQLWTGGAASCTATLVSFDKNGRGSSLASTTFTVSG